MVALGDFLGPRKVVIFAKPRVPDPTLGSRLIAFLLSDATVFDPNGFALDTAHDRQHRHTYQWTRSPVERLTADNVIKQPNEVRVRGTLTATPIGGLLGGLQAAESAIPGIVRRDRRLADKLLRIADRGEPVVLVTPERPYPSMGITFIEEAHGRGEKIDLTLGFAAVRIVDPLAVASDLEIQATVTGALATSAMGGQPVTSVPDPGGLG